MKLSPHSLNIYSVILLLFGCSDSPPDYPDPDQVNCGEQGGTCTADPAIVCSPGTQPLYSNDPTDTNCLGHCCIPQSESNTCNRVSTDTDALSIYNCVPDDEFGTPCPDGWASVAGNLSCDEGRSCCYRR